MKSDFISKLASVNEASNFKISLVKEKRAFIDTGLSLKSKVKNKEWFFLQFLGRYYIDVPQGSILGNLLLNIFL